MKAAHVVGVDDVRLIDVAPPVAGPDDVVLRIAFAGICGSDLGFAKRGGLSGPSETPLAIGHELSGVVSEVGGNVTSVSVGDRVIVDPLVNRIGNGAPEGGFAERLLIRDVVGRPRSLLPLPDTVTLAQGALAEPLAVAMHALNRAEARAGEKVAVFGAGPIGLATVAALRARGVDDVVAFDLSAFRRKRALALGAAAAFDPGEAPPAEVLAERHGVERMWGHVPVVGTDLFVEATGVDSVVAEMVDMGRFNSRIAIVSIHKVPVRLDLMMLTAKEMSITTAMGYPTELPDAIALLGKAGGALAPLVSHRFDGDDFLAAFATAKDAAASAKVLVEYAS